MATRGTNSDRPRVSETALVFWALLALSTAQVALPPHQFSAGGRVGVPLNTASGHTGAASHAGPTGVPLPASTSFSRHPGSTSHAGGVPLPAPTSFSTPHGSSVGVPLSTASGVSTSRGTAFTAGGSRVGVPLPPPTRTNNGGRYTTLGVSGPVFVPTVGRGIQDTKPQGNFGGFRTPGSSTSFHINDLPTSIELDKSLSPVPPYFVFSDDDSKEGGLTIGGPKTGGLLPITSPTTDPKLLRLLSQPMVRRRLVAEASADRALKISAILMAHRQVVGGQITYASLRVAETNCPANRINSLRGCNIDSTEDTYICEVAFWERPWLNVTRILDEKTGCSETETDAEFDEDSPRGGNSLRGVVEGGEVGGVWSQSPSLPAGLTQQQLAVEAFNYVDAHSDSNFRGYLAGHSVHSVLVDRSRNLTKVQVWVDYGFTICLKLDWTSGGQKDPRNCPVDPTRARYSCALTLLYHPSQLMPLRVVHGDDKDELTCTKKVVGTGAATAQGGLQASPAGAALPPLAGGKELQGCPGCPVQAALSDPAILAMLKFAVQEYDRVYSDDDNLHKPVSLIAAYTQATAGTKYVLTVEVAETICRKGVAGQDWTTCPQDPTEQNEVCMFIVLHQPWLPSSHLLSAKCLDKDEAHRFQQDFLLSASSTALPPHPVGPSSGPHGVPLPTTNGLKPVSLSFGPSRNSSTAALSLDAKTTRLVQFIVDQVNKRELRDDLDSRGRDDSREYDDDDDSIEFGGRDTDGYYQLVKVHKVGQMSASGQQRIVLELGETNCSQSVLPRPSSAHCSLDPFEEHEVCDALVTSRGAAMILDAVSCEDLGDYLGQSSLVPPVPSVTWVPAPFLPVGQLAAASRPQTATGFSSTLTGPYSKMQTTSTSSPAVRKAGELVVARYNLLSGEDELAAMTRVLSAHTQVAVDGAMQYLLEVEMAETRCKKYLPIIDQSKCPIDHSEDQIVCQAEVQQRQAGLHPTGQQTAWDGLVVNKLYCREREEYITVRATGQEGPWTPMAPNDPKLLQLATFTADQYDLRSDDDDLFILHKIVSARYQNVSGIRYDVVVELAETICPKYKEHINKARCRVDPSEDIKLCNAQLFEPPSSTAGTQVTKLQCRDKPVAGVHGSHESSEVLVLPSVHPSAHARPRFLNKFRKPTFRARLDDSVESAESNEQFYNNPRQPGHRHGATGRHHFDSRSEEDDSDEFLPRSSRGRRSLPAMIPSAAAGITDASAAGPRP